MEKTFIGKLSMEIIVTAQDLKEANAVVGDLLDRFQVIRTEDLDLSWDDCNWTLEEDLTTE